MSVDHQIDTYRIVSIERTSKQHYKVVHFTYMQ